MSDDEVDRSEEGASPRAAKPALQNIGGVLAALAATGLTFGMIWLVTSEESHTRQLFFERSWIQYVTVSCFWLTLVLLGRRWLAHRSENSAVDVVEDILDRKRFSTSMVWHNAPTVLKAIDEPEFEAHQATRSFHRLRHGMRRLHNTRNTRELDAYFRARSDLDHAELDTRYAMLRYLVWLIPTLGFIGTVLGIGGGISGFAVALEGAADFQAVRAELPQVTGQLGTAFDTTLLALLLSVVVGLVMAQVRRLEEGILDRLDGVCVDRVCGLFQESSPETEQLVGTINEAIQKLLAQMNGSRAKTERVITEKLPVLIVQRLERGDGEVRGVLNQLAETLDSQNQILESRLPQPTAAQTPSAEEELLRRILLALETRNRLASRVARGDGSQDA